MISHNVAAHADLSQNNFRPQGAVPNAEWIFSKALSHCEDVFRNRQQSVMLAKVAVDDTGGIDGDELAELLALALRDMSALSRRGAMLSLTAADRAIVIESHHPLDIPGEGLEMDNTIRQEARGLHVAAEMTWDQGRGPRLTLMLPATGNGSESRA